MNLGRNRQRLRARYGAGGSAPLTTPLTAVAADGWYCTYPGIVGNSTQQIDPIGNPEYLPLTRAGYSTAGAPTTYSENLLLTTCIRQITPNEANFEANAATVEDFVYSSACDTGPAGFTNNSTLVSPKPIANWALADRELVGDTINLEVVAFHRNGRNGLMVPAIKFIATDGINPPVEQIVTGTVVSGRSSDRHAVVVTRCALNVSTLASGNTALITVNAEVMPWIGVDASIARSADSSVRHEFSPRYYLRNTTRFAAPPVCYVTDAAYTSGGDAVPVGNDATGVWSTNPVTAKANPFLTILAARNAIITQSAVTNGIADGCQIRIGLVSTPLAFGSPAALLPQNCASLVVCRDPEITKAQARVSWGAAGYRPRMGGNVALLAPLAETQMVLKELTVTRTGTSTFQGETTNGAAGSPVIVVFDDIDLNTGGFTGAITSGGASGLVVQGCDILTGACNNLFNAAAACNVRMLRGVQTITASGTTEGRLVLGSTMFESGALTDTATRPVSGSIVAFNRFTNVSSSVNVIGIGGSPATLVTQYAVWQNEFIASHTTSSTPGIGLSRDFTSGVGGTASTIHVVCGNNTMNTGGSVARHNVFYDWDTPGRTHTLYAHVGDVAGQINNKGDVFIPANPLRIGQRAYWNGVGCQGNFTQYQVNSPPGEQQSYPGLRSNIATSPTVLNDPLFVAPLGTTFNGSYTAGTATAANPGDLRLQAGSPCKGMIIKTRISHDLRGNARPLTNSSAGANE